ncbi:MAG: hypothetical protein MUE78_03945 [Ilumatobacteraceae bacterium]|jgi:hypothetical protein|nr:hypothetical protein [Ilumatobacteraceae bacterium]
MSTYSILATACAGVVAYALGNRSWESSAFGAWQGAVLLFGGLGRTRTAHVTTMPNPQTKRSARHLGTITT